jgi:hypothetical protein
MAEVAVDPLTQEKTRNSALRKLEERNDEEAAVRKTIADEQEDELWRMAARRRVAEPALYRDLDALLTGRPPSPPSPPYEPYVHPDVDIADRGVAISMALATQPAVRPHILAPVARTQQYDRYSPFIPARIDEPYSTALSHSGMDYQPVRASCLLAAANGEDCYRASHVWFGFTGTIFYLRTSTGAVSFFIRDQWGYNVKVVIYKGAATGKRDEPTDLVRHYPQLRTHQRYLILCHREWVERSTRPNKADARIEIRLKRGSMVGALRFLSCPFYHCILDSDHSLHRRRPGQI